MMQTSFAWILVLLLNLLFIGVVVVTVIIFWRWMRAHERVADSLAGIERALSSRSDTQ